MTRLLVMIGLVATAPLFAQTKEPTDTDVAAAYQVYRASLCVAAGLVDANGMALPSCTGSGSLDTGAQRVLLEEHCDLVTAAPICTTVKGWNRTVRLLYDHAGSSWIVPAGPLGKRTELDVNQVPTVALQRNERLFAVVQNTNPLLYSVTAEEIKPENIDQLADLQKLAGLLGGNIGAVLTARDSAAKVIAGDTTFDDVRIALKSVGDDIDKAKCISTAATRYSFNAVSFIQQIESGHPGFYDLSSETCDTIPADAAAFDPAWLDLVADQAVVGRYCTDVFDALAALTAADPTKVADVRAALMSYEVALLNPRCSFMNDRLPVAGNPPPTRNEFLRVQHLDEITNQLGNPANLDSELTKARNALRPKVLSIQTLLKSGGEAITQLVTGGGAVRKALASREVFRNRVLSHAAGSVAGCPGSTHKCVKASEVTRLLVVKGGPTKVTWDKVQPHPIKIAVDSPFAADVTAARPVPVATSYRAKSVASSVWDIGVAVTKTDLASPVFGAAKTDPADAKPKIVITDEESRSGKLAMMFNYLPLRQLFPTQPKSLTALGVQIGAGLDTGNPAFFWGLSYGLGKYVRIGYGETSQRVKTLRDGQMVGSEVVDKDAIKTRQEFRNDRYFSVTISIGSLKFFNAG